MKLQAVLIAVVLYSGATVAGDVYVTKDSQGNVVYTDTPRTIPAQLLDIRVPEAHQAAPQQGSASQPQTKVADAATGAKPPPSASRASAEAMADDKVKRCTDSRQQYQTLMNSWRVFEPGPNGERIYLTSEQIDAAREDARKAMEQFCSDAAQ